MNPSPRIVVWISLLIALPLFAACNSPRLEMKRTAIVAMVKDGKPYNPDTNRYIDARADIARLLAGHRLELSEHSTEARYMATVTVDERGVERRLAPLSLLSIEQNPQRRLGTVRRIYVRRPYVPEHSESIHRLHPSLQILERVQSMQQ